MRVARPHARAAPAGSLPARSHRLAVMGHHGPPVRFRTKTIARFLPASLAAPELLVQEFDRLQAAQLDCLAQADACRLLRCGSRRRSTRACVQFVLVLTILPRTSIGTCGKRSECGAVRRRRRALRNVPRIRTSTLAEQREIPAHDGNRPLHGDAGVRGPAGPLVGYLVGGAIVDPGTALASSVRGLDRASRIRVAGRYRLVVR